MMKISKLVCLAALPAVLLASAFAANPIDASSPEAIYQRERAQCESGRTVQDRPTCLKEAGAALDEARRGQLKTADNSQLIANALERCQLVPPTDRSACEAMARGGGLHSGSVSEGAVLKEISTVTSPPASAASR
jgi:hypothetical protein